MKSSVQVKICGITNPEDARWAANLGADYVGLNFVHESPRKISLEKAGEIVKELPSFVQAVGVFLSPDPLELKKVVKSVRLSALQFHGEESPEFLQQCRTDYHLPVWKAIRIQGEESLNKIPVFAEAADVLLLDSWEPGLSGGTGKSFDWELALKAKEHGRPLFLSGGLTPENVGEAVRKVKPNGVDVASGVEKPGQHRRKDKDRMKMFIENAKDFSK